MAPVDELLLLHGALLSGAPRAQDRFVAAVMPRLRAILRRRHAPLPRDLVLDAATDAVLFLLTSPERYRPAYGSVLNFMVHIADNRVRDALRRLQRRKELSLDTQADVVEFLTLTTNYEQNTVNVIHPTGSDPDTLPPEIETLLCDILPDPIDRQVWEMVCQGRADAAEYAALLGLTHLPPAQQRIEIKRRGDKVVARIRRRRAEFQDLL